jgi:hypothetical protein
MRALKILVVVMGVMIVAGFTALVVAIAERTSSSGSPAARSAFASGPIDIPRGARIEAMTTGGDRLIVGLQLPDSNRQLLIIDLATGVRIGAIELHPMP